MTLQEKKNIARLIIEKKLTVEPNKEDEIVRIVSQTYETFYLKYKNKPAGKYLKKEVTERPSIRSTWLAIAKRAEECGATIEEYIHSQFWFCDKYLNRAPKVIELNYQNTAVPCIKRYEIYKQHSHITTNTNIVARETHITTTDTTRATVCEKVIKQLSTRQKVSEEDLFIKLYQEGTYFLFVDKKWFESHPIFRSLKDNNRI